jgi:Amt family ammonium transporter
VNGLWGVLSVGIFASGEYGAGWNGVIRPEYVEKYGADGVRGLLYGDPTQILAQLSELPSTVSVFGFVDGLRWFKISDASRRSA